MKYFTAIFIFFAVAALLPAGEEVSLSKSGQLLFKDSLNRIEWNFFGEKYRNMTRMSSKTLEGTISNPKPGVTRLKGKWHIASNVLDTDFSLIPTGREKFRFQFRLSTQDGKEHPAAICVPVMSIPVSTNGDEIFLDGQKIELPGTFKNLVVFQNRDIRERTFRFQAGDTFVTISGTFGIRIQDDRKYKQQFYTVRFFIQKENTPVRTINAEWTISSGKPRFQTVDLSKSANMGFADPVADDGKGGWTDQGPSNDFAGMKSGERNLAGVLYRVLDPAKNSGRSCVVVCNPGFRHYPETKPVMFPDGAQGKYLYLLHGSAWSPRTGENAAELELTYRDGTRRIFMVKGGRDCGNWWRPTDLSNAKVACTVDRNGETVGLYSSAFALDDKPVASMKIRPCGNTVYILVGVTLADQMASVSKNTRFIVRKSAGWSVLDHNEQIEKASPLDFSSGLEAPAGKFGRVIVRDGRFVFEQRPDKRIRFFGVNICNRACFPKHEETDRMVERLRRLGYNSVRIHQIDRFLFDQKANDTRTVDMKQLDKLDYLLAKCKEAGLYITIDLYSFRQIRPGDGVAELKKGTLELKTLFAVSPSAMETWKQFAKFFLTRKNPYTGLSISEDPAFYSAVLVNEGGLPGTWDRFPALIHVIDRAYDMDRKARNLPIPKGKERRNADFFEFLVRQEGKNLQEMMSYVRNDLKFKGLLTSYNNNSRYYQFPLREKLDFVDNHTYLDHPSYPIRQWYLPAALRQKSSLSEFGWMPASIADSREYGKPFVVSEFQFANPNRFRSECGTVVSALAGLQDHDGYYRFCYGDPGNYRARGSFFSQNGDPVGQLTERMLYFLFARGDLAPAEEGISFAWDDAVLKKHVSLSATLPEDFYRLGYYGRIGNRRAGKKLPAKIHPVAAENWKQELPNGFAGALEKIRSGKVLTSATGEVEFDSGAERMKIVTPRSEAFSLPKGRMTGRVLDVGKIGVFTTFGLHSLDGNKLSESSSLLLFHIVNVLPDKMNFRDSSCRLMETWGDFPMLSQDARAEISLRFDNPEAFDVFVLDWNGAVREKIPVRVSGKKLCFIADTKGGKLIYHIVRKNNTKNKKAK